MNFIKRYFHNRRLIKEAKDFADGYGFTATRMLHHKLNSGFALVQLVALPPQYLKGMHKAVLDITELRGDNDG